MAQTVTIEVDWTSKSGAADATVAFGETFNVSITGMSNVTGHLRLVLLSQSVSSEEAVLWSKEYPVSTQEEGPVEIESVRIFTPNVYDALKAQGGKAKLYLSVLNVRGEETVTDDDGETNQVSITTDYGVARITLTLGSYLEDGPIPEDFDPDTMTVAELQAFLTQVKIDTQTYKNSAEDFADAAGESATEASGAASDAASSAGEAEGFADAAQTTLGEVTDLKSATESNVQATSADAETCATAAEQAVAAAASAKGYADATQGSATKVEQYIADADALAETVVSIRGDLTGLANTAVAAKDTAVEAKDTAVEAKDTAVEAAEAAEIALNNGCIYEIRTVTDSAIALEKTLTAYKHTPSADAAYTFTAPTEADGKIIVFWLWIVMGETAHQLTFDSTITWLSEPAFAANTETLLAFMSVDGGATWQANVQWEVSA